jgi:hypothetical protein
VEFAASAKRMAKQHRTSLKRLAKQEVEAQPKVE